MATSPPSGLPANDYPLRLLLPADAAGVARLVESVYGDSYYPRDLYDADRIVRLNEAGQLVSVVALWEDGQVVGHYALERSHLGATAESSDALVLPEHRHRHLLEAMRVLLRQEALRLELAGLVGYPVTNHLFSQKAEEHFGAHPCGVALGLWPRSFHNMPEPLPQRMSFVVYFKYLRPPALARHADTPHREVCARIYRQFDIPVGTPEGGEALGPGEIEVEFEAAVEAGTIRVHCVGTGTVEAIRLARRELCEVSGAKAVSLELPLAQAATAEACRAAEEDGFFFCGLGPAFARDGDALLLQWLGEDLDPSLVQVESPFARDLLGYVVAERKRVRKAGRP